MSNRYIVNDIPGVAWVVVDTERGRKHIAQYGLAKLNAARKHASELNVDDQLVKSDVKDILRVTAHLGVTDGLNTCRLFFGETRYANAYGEFEAQTEDMHLHGGVWQTF